jgi:hypothetical protein
MPLTVSDVWSMKGAIFLLFCVIICKLVIDAIPDVPDIMKGAIFVIVVTLIIYRDLQS